MLIAVSCCTLPGGVVFSDERFAIIQWTHSLGQRAIVQHEPCLGGSCFGTNCMSFVPARKPAAFLKRFQISSQKAVNP